MSAIPAIESECLHVKIFSVSHWVTSIFTSRPVWYMAVRSQGNCGSLILIMYKVYMCNVSILCKEH